MLTALALATVLSAALAPAASDESPPVPPGCTLNSGADLLGEFLVVSSTPGDIVQALDRDGAQVEFLLATVPEPRLGFDGAVEAISTALEASGRTLDRFALPWTQHADKSGIACQEHLPGVGLFVQPPEPGKHGRRLLLLYLIGESPTAGLFREPMLRAMREMNSLRGELPAPRCNGCDKLRFLGPAFSGGVASIEQMLEHPVMSALPITFISGRATDGDVKQILEGHSRKERPVSFQSTLIPDETLQTEFFCYLTETLGADEHDIALLTESTTVYGQAAAQPPSWHGSPHANLTRPKSTHCRSPHRPRLTLSVPLHISRLSTVWQAREAAASKSADRPPTTGMMSDALFKALPKMIDSSERTDVIPTLSPLSIESTDRALAQILTTIAGEQVRYVGLIFTDVQDTLFMAEQVRKFCPDTILFTFENDILFTHPEARAVLKGMLSVSAYPLFTRNQQWSYPFRGYTNPIQFARDSDQGVYNATVALLDRPDLLIEYSQPRSAGGSPNGRRPPVWVSTVGIDTLFPLTYVADYKDDGFVYRNPIQPRAPNMYVPMQQGTLTIMLLALGLFGVVIAAGYFRCYYASPNTELKAPWTLFRLFTRCTLLKANASTGIREEKWQPIFMLAIFGPMALLYPFFATVHFVQLRDGNREIAQVGLSLWQRLLHHSGHLGIYEGLSGNVLTVGVCAAACQLIFLFTTFDVLLACFGRGQALRSWLGRMFFARPRLLGMGATVVFLLGTVGAFRAFLAIVNVLQYDFTNLVFMRRAAHPAFGLSPLTPLWMLISAMQLWGYCNLQRIRLYERLSMVFFDLNAELQDETRLRTQLERMAQQLESPQRWQLLGAILAALVLVSSIFADVVSLESYPLNFLFRLLFGLICVTVGLAAFRFLRLWLHFSRLLDLVAHHPLRPALERLPDSLSRSIGSLFLEELPEHARQEAEQQHLRLLANHLQGLDLEHELRLLPVDEADQIRPFFAELKTLMPTWMQNSLTGFVEDVKVVRASRLLVQILKTFWRLRPLPGTLPEPNTVPIDRSTASVYLQAMPSGMVLWLRLAEDFIAIQLVTYIHRLFPHLRNVLILLMGGLLLFLTAVFIYPFQPQRFLMLVLWTLVLGGVGLSVMVFIQMNRNDALSRIAKTAPGKLTVDRRLVSQIVVYGVLPILSLLATQFPEVRGYAFSWVETILKTLK